MQVRNLSINPINFHTFPHVDYDRHYNSIVPLSMKYFCISIPKVYRIVKNSKVRKRFVTFTVHQYLELFELLYVQGILLVQTPS